MRASDLRTLFSEYGVTNIEVFGSVARGDDDEDSDIDLLVDIAPTVGLFDLLRVQSAAEALLGRAVDVVPRQSLRPGVAEAIRDEVVPL